jgi:hypothetical protein
MMDKSLSLFARMVLLGAGVLALVAGPALFFFPYDTERYFAWAISHPLTPIFMGASYAAGVGNLAAVRANRWSLARVQVPAIIVFATAMLVATLLHIPLFNWSHPIAWAWLAVYIVSPVAAVVVWLRGERGYVAPSFSGRRLPRSFAAVIGIVAVADGLLGGLLFVAPAFVASWWPWSLTPLTARVIGGWYLGAAALGWMLARQQTLDTAWIGLLANLVIGGMLLAGAARLWETFDGPRIMVWFYVLSYVGFVAYCAYSWWASLRKT